MSVFDTQHQPLLRPQFAWLANWNPGSTLMTTGNHSPRFSTDSCINASTIYTNGWTQAVQISRSDYLWCVVKLQTKQVLKKSATSSSPRLSPSMKIRSVIPVPNSRLSALWRELCKVHVDSVRRTTTLWLPKLLCTEASFSRSLINAGLSISQVTFGGLWRTPSERKKTLRT